MAKGTKTVEIPAELRPVIEAAAKNLTHHLYGAGGPPWGTAFADLEELATQVGRTLGAELLQTALQRQAQQPTPPPLQLCPVCSGPLEQADGEPRPVLTRTGPIDWHEPSSTCGRCRKAFFPSVQEPGH